MKYYKFKEINGRKYEFNPEYAYKAIAEDEHRFLDEFLNEALYAKRGISFESDAGVTPETKEHLNFRLRNKNLCYKLLKDYAEYYFADRNVMNNYGLFHNNESSYSENNIPDIHIDRLREMVALPLKNNERLDLIKAPKRALYPPEKELYGNTYYSQQWFIGEVKGEVYLFRLYQEENISGRYNKYHKENSGISLEVYAKGRAEGGKMLMRDDFKPVISHRNLFENGEVVDYGVDLSLNTHKMDYRFNFADHRHFYNLGHDIAMPRHNSCDIKLILTEAHTYEELVNNFYNNCNMDTTPIFSKKEPERNASLIELAKKYLKPKEKLQFKEKEYVK